MQNVLLGDGTTGAERCWQATVLILAIVSGGARSPPDIWGPLGWGSDVWRSIQDQDLPTKNCATRTAGPMSGQHPVHAALSQRRTNITERPDS